MVADAVRVFRLDNACDVVTAHQRHVRLWRAAEHLSVPEPLDVDARRGVRWEARVAGLRIDTIGIETTSDELPPDMLAAQVAAAASGMHRCLPRFHAGPLLPARGSAELLDRLRRKTLRMVQRALPGQAERFGSLIESLESSRPDPGAPVLVHGDLHMANALRTEAGIVLLDVDEMGCGEPELDLAMFAGRMLLMALHQGDGLAEAAAFTALLPERYAAVAARPIVPSTYAWYLAAVLAGRQVKTAIRHLVPDLHPLYDELIGLAERTVEAGRFDVESVGALAVQLAVDGDSARIAAAAARLPVATSSTA